MHIVRLNKLDAARQIIRWKILEKGGNLKEYEEYAIDNCARLLVSLHPEWFARNPD
jgi:hypothetical protein